MRPIGETILCTGLLCIAAYEDLKSYRVSNEIIWFGWTVGILYHIWNDGGYGILIWGMDSLFPIILLFILFFFKALGAGDVKLFSMISGLLGIRIVCNIIIISFCLGAVVSFIQMLYFGILKDRFLYFICYFKEQIKQYKPYRGKISRAYYSAPRDGRKCVIPFSAVILGAMVYYLLFHGIP